MGLHLSYELHYPGEADEADVARLIGALRERALALPFDAVSEIVRLDERAMAEPSPLHGLRFARLEDVAHVAAVWQRDVHYRQSLGMTDEDEYEVLEDGTHLYRPVEVPADVPAVAIGFAIAPARGSEPATFGLCRLGDEEHRTRWSWHCYCKTQYASMVSDENLVRCHTSLVALLDALPEVAGAGMTVEVHDETGYWESRDVAALVASVTAMNRIVAGFAGQLTDAVRDAGGDSAQVQGAIFEHPDFERLETEGG
jgi:hypothetical protein